MSMLEFSPMEGDASSSMRQTQLTGRAILMVALFFVMLLGGMMAAAFISLVPLKAVPAWAATTVVARDFLITGLRLMASAKGQILPAERFGKQKTSWQVITIIFFLGLLSASELRYANEKSIWWFRAWNDAGPILVWITIALTVYSGLGYAWRHRELIAREQ